MQVAAALPVSPKWDRLALLLHAHGCPLDAVGNSGEFALGLALDNGARRRLPARPSACLLACPCLLVLFPVWV